MTRSRWVSMPRRSASSQAAVRSGCRPDRIWAVRYVDVDSTITSAIPSVAPGSAVGGLEHGRDGGGDDRPALDHGGDHRGADRTRPSSRCRGSPASRAHPGRAGSCGRAGVPGGPARRRPARSGADRPSEMVLEESCWRLPPASTTVRTATTRGAQHPADDEAPGVATPAAHQDGDVGDEPERFDRDDQSEADGGEHGSAWQRGASRGGTSRSGGQSRAT